MQYKIVKEMFLVKLPQGMSWEEVSCLLLQPVQLLTSMSQACTIPCAGTTAWNALGRPLKPRKDTVAVLEGRLIMLISLHWLITFRIQALAVFRCSAPSSLLLLDFAPF